MSFNQIVNISLQVVFTIFKYGFSTYEYIKKNFKRILPDHITIVNYTVYNDFEIHTYKFIKDNIVYFFDYIIKNEDKNNIQLLDEILNDTNNNLINKDDNKKKILHASIMTDTDTFLCDITDLLKRFRYYFDSYNEIDNEIDNVIDNEIDLTDNSNDSDNNDSDDEFEIEDNCEIIDSSYSVHKLYWKDILEIINSKYNKNLLPNNIYLYTILNDDELTEKTTLFSSILNKKVRF